MRTATWTSANSWASTMTDPWQEFYDWMDSREQLRLDAVRSAVLSFGMPPQTQEPTTVTRPMLIIRGAEGEFIVDPNTGERTGGDGYPEMVRADVHEMKRWWVEYGIKPVTEIDVLLVGG